ncbi:hypothetical protein PLESTB_001170200 [Pleodorina starrii]|uniref:Uncharacterized protein n=1 Tax=Pleodorina starrii TaxID=330485 RepID=A0A9W6F5A6_9CHLO|nr:hypothetical protein PLESTB_001170200 [Pleodorina starrii]GLC64816.1 hypothetical protein PLESTF_000210500 [Pleodorina starrii]
MAETGAAAEHRPTKRAKNTQSIQDRGPDLRAELLLKYSLRLPQSFTPGAIQANRLALRAQGDRCLAYVANAQHVYEVSLGSDLSTAADASLEGGVVQGKEGVLVPRVAQVGHVRQLNPLSYMAAEVQGLYSGVHGSHHLLAAVDAVGNARLLAAATGGGSGSGGGEEDGDVDGGLQCMSLHAPNRGECGWTGLALRSLGSGAAAAAGGGECGGGGGPVLEVAVARQQLRDVNVYRDGALIRSLHTLQGPTALTYLPPGASGGGGGGASEVGGSGTGLLAVAEEHQLSLWDVRQGERGGCTQRLGVFGGGSPVFSLNWVASPRQHSGGGGGGGGCGGMLAATGWERSVVMLEPRKWHIVAKWPGCVKYPATHMAPSAAAPGYVYVAGLDYECVAGRWDGSSGSSTGNANSSSGGHGRATGPAPAQLKLGAAAAMDDGPEGGASRGGLSFRGDSKWLGLARESLTVSRRAAGGIAAAGGGSDGGGGGGGSREVAAALSLSGTLLVMMTSAATSREAPTA